MSLGRSCFIGFSSFSTSASKSDCASSSTLILSSSCDSLVFDSNCSWIAVSCCTHRSGLRRDPHNACMIQKWMFTCACKACTSRSLRLVISSCCTLSTSWLAFSLVVSATLSMKRLATFCSRSFTLSSSSPTLDCNSSGASTSLPSVGMAASSDCTYEQKVHL